MTLTTRIRGLVAIALGLGAAPVHAQFDLLRNLVPQVGFAQNVYNNRKRLEEVAAIERLAGSGHLAEAARRADALVVKDQKLAMQSPRSPALPPLAQSARIAADLHERMGNDARALVLCQTALAAAGGTLGQFELYECIGALQYKTGAFADAMRTYQTMLTAPGNAMPLFRPLRFKAYAGLGRAALAAGDDVVAESNLLLAIAEDPTIARQTDGTKASNTLFDVQAAVRAATGRAAETLASLDAQRTVMDANGEMIAAVHITRTGSGGILEGQGPLTDLAQLYYRKGDSAALKNLYHGKFSDYAARVLEVNTGTLGPSAELEKQHARFGAYFAGLREGALAEQAFRQALSLNARRLASTAAEVQPELLANSFAVRRQILDLLLSLHQAQGDDARRWRATLGELLQSKGLQSDFMARRARVIGQARDPDVRRLAADMEAIDGLQGTEHEIRRWNLGAALQAKISKLLPALVFEDGERFLAQVEQHLGGETLVSVSAFTEFDLSNQRFGARRYLGARIGPSGLLITNLGAAAALDATSARLRAELGRPPGRGAVQPVLPAARMAYDALLKPLLGKQGAKGNYVADLDGELSLLPMEALSDGKRYLIDSGEWRYISSARTLLRSTGSSSAAGPSVVLAAPDYDLQGATPTATTGTNGRGAALRTLRFAALPQTLEEGNAVAAALRRSGAQVTLYAGKEANLSVLERLRSPRFLHIATHGFFVEEAGIRTERTIGNDGARYVVESQVAGRSSGLALAGANATLAASSGNGVIFAAQLRQIDLAATELAVLSACDTAVGTVHVGEGVDSLRQALEIAGARSMVTSLWSVPDLETRAVMTDFYNSLADGSGKPSALRNAKLRLKERQPHPFYWAAFVATGMR